MCINERDLSQTSSRRSRAHPQRRMLGQCLPLELVEDGVTIWSLTIECSSPSGYFERYESATSKSYFPDLMKNVELLSSEPVLSLVYHHC